MATPQPLESKEPLASASSAFEEMGLYEHLWSEMRSFDKVSETLGALLNPPKGVAIGKAIADRQKLFNEAVKQLQENSVANLVHKYIVHHQEQVRLLHEEITAPSRLFSAVAQLARMPAMEISKASKITGMLSQHGISQSLNETEQAAKVALETLRKSRSEPFGIHFYGEADYPERLLMAEYPAYCLYSQGYWNITESPCVSVVGTRKPTDEGRKRAYQLAKKLVADDYTVVSGLAEGIDTVAHQTAMDEGGHTIAVLGTPLCQQYPKSNQALRNRIAKEQLVVTQYPTVAKTQPFFFTERNKLMSALSEATVIVEAGETSGTRVQARAALHQKRKLFILDSCFKRKDITWPAKFEEQGAIRVRTYEDISRHLKHPRHARV